MGAHKTNRVLTVHADPCLSALTESEPLVRTGAQVGCHCHNGSGFAPTVMLIFIARPFPGSWRMDVRGSQVCCPHRSCCTLMRCYSIVKIEKCFIALHKVAVGNGGFWQSFQNIGDFNNPETDCTSRYQ